MPTAVDLIKLAVLLAVMAGVAIAVVGIPLDGTLENVFLPSSGTGDAPDGCTLETSIEVASDTQLNTFRRVRLVEGSFQQDISPSGLTEFSLLSPTVRNQVFLAPEYINLDYTLNGPIDTSITKSVDIDVGTILQEGKIRPEGFKATKLPPGDYVLHHNLEWRGESRGTDYFKKTITVPEGC